MKDPQAPALPPEILTGDGVVLRRWRSDEADAVFALVSGSLNHIRAWMPWAQGTYSLLSARSFLADESSGWATGTDFAFALLTDEGEQAGAAGLHRRIGVGGIEIGYWLHPSFTGRALANRAAWLLTGAAFELPDVDRVEIHHDAANVRSAAVPSRLGFVEISRAPREKQAPAEVGVEVIWRMTREAWGRQTF